jgi:hypothetical protein
VRGIPAEDAFHAYQLVERGHSVECSR